MALIFTALLSGLLFGTGLIIAGMVNPSKVLGFLDVAGNWDPSLALVMAGALATLGSLQYFIFKRAQPIFENHFHLPKNNSLDSRLVIGSALFGIGWGMIGLCPGPAIVNVHSANTQLWLFLLAMSSGIALGKFLHKN